MKVDTKIIKKEDASVLLEVLVNKESIEAEYNKILQRYQDISTIPGFRKGKAPANLIKSKYENHIKEDVLGNLIPSAYSEAISIENIEPYTVPDIKVEKFDMDVLKFNASIQLRPEVEISNYKGISFHKDDYKISDKDITNELIKLQEKFADYSLKEDRKIEDNDRVTLEINAVDDEGNTIKELSDENHKLDVNKTGLYDEFYKNIIGLKPDEEKEFTKEYPEDFNNKMLAGKKVTYNIKIKEVQVKNLPALDDNFAKDVGEYKSFDELKTVIEDQLKSMLESQLEIRLEKSIIEKIVSHSKFKIPKKLIENRSNTLLNEFKQNLTRQGHNFDDMEKQKMIDPEKMGSEVREQAVKDLKEYLTIMKIIEKEEIKVEEKEVDDFIRAEAEKYKQKFEDYKKKLSKDMISYINNDIQTKKVLSFLKENNKIKKGKTYKMDDILKETEHKR